MSTIYWYLCLKCSTLSPQVPSSCMALQKKLSEEVVWYKEKGIPPVLNQSAFSQLAQSLDSEDNNIMDAEELSQGMCILYYTVIHLIGVLIHTCEP